MAGSVIYLFMCLFVNAKESAIFGLTKAFFGTVSLAGTGSLSYIDPLIVALPASIIIFIVVTLATQPLSIKDSVIKQ
ncbi:Sodium/proline symporter [Desulfosporosinus sp. I2]|nr:Sodium/proline symporter [Desulfosporosinus sp. I2]